MAVKLIDPPVQVSISADDQRLNEVGSRVWDAVEASEVPVKADDLAKQLRAEGLPGDLIHIAILYLIDNASIQWTSGRSLAAATFADSCAEGFAEVRRSPATR